MNRYQFEDLISEYIENELSLSKRKEFETYLEENPDARSLVDSVRYTMDTMRSLPKVKANTKFNERLMTRIKTNIDWNDAEKETLLSIKGLGEKTINNITEKINNLVDSNKEIKIDVED